MHAIAGGYPLSVSEDMRQEDVKQFSENHRSINILRSTPPRFSIEHFLSSDKSTGNCHHGMHIYSDTEGKCISISSRGSLSRYDIWRSWEDCLWFQHTLEEEYKRAAREKKRRLAQGKGVKGFNGLYKKDMASSWDSLPPGPDHHSVAQDIHEHLPILTRRGTVFRASQVTIDRRQAELVAFVQALFSDGMPALIKEIRASRIVSEFFGLWRSDFDSAQISQALSTGPRKSLINSYFSASHLSLPSSDATPRNSPSKGDTKSLRSLRSTSSRPISFADSNEITEEPRYSCGSSRRLRSRRLSTSSDSSALSESSTDTSSSSSSGSDTADNASIVLGHNDQFNPILEVLPEEQETLQNPLEPCPEPKPRPRVPATECKPRRSYSFFGLSLQKNLFSSEKLDDRSVRESWQSTDSQDSTVNDFLDGLGLVLPHPIKEQKFRASIASISTFMTTNSADAVIPQGPSPQQLSSMLNVSSTSLSLPDTDAKLSVPDAPPHPVSSTSESVEGQETLETLVDDLRLRAKPSSTSTTLNRPSFSSLSSSAFSTTSTSLPSDSICIKAIHDTCIILLRVPRRIGFAQVRQRLYDKFTNQEGVPLSETYKVVFVVPNNNPPPPPARSAATTTCPAKNQTDVQVIALDSDWEQLMLTIQSNKITLRIQDS